MFLYCYTFKILDVDTVRKQLGSVVRQPGYEKALAGYCEILATAASQKEQIEGDLVGECVKELWDITQIQRDSLDIAAARKAAWCALSCFDALSVCSVVSKTPEDWMALFAKLEYDERRGYCMHCFIAVDIPRILFTFIGLVTFLQKLAPWFWTATLPLFSVIVSEMPQNGKGLQAIKLLRRVLREVHVVDEEVTVIFAGWRICLVSLLGVLTENSDPLKARDQIVEECKRSLTSTELSVNNVLIALAVLAAELKRYGTLIGNAQAATDFEVAMRPWFIGVLEFMLPIVKKDYVPKSPPVIQINVNQRCVSKNAACSAVWMTCMSMSEQAQKFFDEEIINRALKYKFGHEIDPDGQLFTLLTGGELEEECFSLTVSKILDVDTVRKQLGSVVRQPGYEKALAGYCEILATAASQKEQIEGDLVGECVKELWDITQIQRDSLNIAAARKAAWCALSCFDALSVCSVVSKTPEDWMALFAKLEYDERKGYCIHFPVSEHVRGVLFTFIGLVTFLQKLKFFSRISNMPLATFRKYERRLRKPLERIFNKGSEELKRAAYEGLSRLASVSLLTVALDLPPDYKHLPEDSILRAIIYELTTSDFLTGSSSSISQYLLIILKRLPMILAVMPASRVKTILSHLLKFATEDDDTGTEILASIDESGKNQIVCDSLASYLPKFKTSSDLMHKLLKLQCIDQKFNGKLSSVCYRARDQIVEECKRSLTSTELSINNVLIALAILAAELKRYGTLIGSAQAAADFEVAMRPWFIGVLEFMLPIVKKDYVPKSPPVIQINVNQRCVSKNAACSAVWMTCMSMSEQAQKFFDEEIINRALKYKFGHEIDPDGQLFTLLTGGELEEECFSLTVSKVWIFSAALGTDELITNSLSRAIPPDDGIENAVRRFDDDINANENDVAKFFSRISNVPLATFRKYERRLRKPLERIFNKGSEELKRAAYEGLSRLASVSLLTVALDLPPDYKHLPEDSILRAVIAQFGPKSLCSFASLHDLLPVLVDHVRSDGRHLPPMEWQFMLMSIDYQEDEEARLNLLKLAFQQKDAQVPGYDLENLVVISEILPFVLDLSS
ncbi:hypothetical protein OESDEN_10778 [Oesophagostomum dentatum]|uniref:Uncharacterized protein n=1 Tax=Oesophagostomum dentatum TaxID=61180 RepID=A0A0B1T1V9_OESDE|nr:hypothetical protein OESDEN_10778 [Oesophagostomum dentatum]